LPALTSIPLKAIVGWVVLTVGVIGIIATSKEICIRAAYLGIRYNYCRAVLSGLRKKKFLSARRLLGGAYVWRLLSPVNPLELSKALKELAEICWDEGALERTLLEALSRELRGEVPVIAMRKEKPVSRELETETELEEEEMWLAETGGKRRN